MAAKDTKRLLSVRKQVKLRKPTYLRTQWNQFAKFSNNLKWRFPVGISNKIRKNKRGHTNTLRIGYGSPKEVRGLNRDGLREVLVQNVADLAKVTAGCVALIGRTVGGRKRAEILTVAQEKKLKVANVKDVTKTLASLKKGNVAPEKKTVKKEVKETKKAGEKKQ